MCGNHVYNNIKKGIAYTAILLMLSINTVAQTTIVNYDFNLSANSTTYGAYSPTVATGITSTLSGTQATCNITTTGVATDGSAFTANATAGRMLQMGPTDGANTKYWEFSITNNSTNRMGYKIYLQAQQSITSAATTLTIAYSTDGASWSNFATTMTITTTWASQVFDLSGVTALNCMDNIYFRVMMSGATSTASTRRVNIDNFQIQANCTAAPPTNFSFTAQSVALSETFGCVTSDYTFTQSIGNSCATSINTGAIATVNFPAGTDATTMTGGTFNGITIGSFTIVSPTQITFITPTTALCGKSFNFVINGITNANNLSSNASVSIINTSGGASSNASYALVTDACPVVTNFSFTAPSLTLCNDLRCAKSGYTLTQTIPANAYAKVPNGKIFTITFPAGTDATSWSSGTYNGTAINMGTATKAATTITFLTPVSVNSGATFNIVLYGIQNGVVSGGNATTSVPNVSGGINSASTYTYSTVACPALANYVFSVPDLSLSSKMAYCLSTYTFTQTLPANKEAQINLGIVTVDFPVGTDVSTMSGGTFNGVAINMGTVTAVGTQVIFTAPIEATSCPGGTFTFSLVGITNVGVGGDYTASVSAINVSGGTDSYTTYDFDIAYLNNFYTYTSNSSYATANAEGNCLNGLEEEKTYCFAYKYPASGTLSFVTAHNCSTGVCGGIFISVPYNTTCGNGGGACQPAILSLKIYDNNCGLVASGVPYGNCMIPGNIYYACITVPVGCDNTGYCPQLQCSGDASCANGTLPVDLLFFDAKRHNNLVKLNWGTATEINNDFFTIERSTDGVLYTIIGKVKGAGTSTSTLFYNAIDPHLYKQVVYYRLKQTDYDGQYKYSRIVAVTPSDYPIEMGITYFYLNADKSTLEFKLENVEENFVSMQIIDMLGNLIRSERIQTNADLSIDISSLNKGVYFLKLTDGGQTEVKKFIW